MYESDIGTAIRVNLPADAVRLAVEAAHDGNRALDLLAAASALEQAQRTCETCRECFVQDDIHWCSRYERGCAIFGFTCGRWQARPDAEEEAMKVLLCANGDGRPVCPPSRVICRECMDRIGRNLRRLVDEASGTTPRSDRGWEPASEPQETREQEGNYEG